MGKIEDELKTETFLMFKERAIEIYKNSDKTIDEMTTLLRQWDCNADEVNAILRELYPIRR